MAVVTWIDPTASPYNCVLNSSTDASANMTGLQDACDDGPVMLPVGTLWIDGSLDLTYPLVGLGHASILKAHSPTAQEKLVEVSGKTGGVFIRDLKLDGNGDSAASGEHAHNIFITGSKHVLVDNVWSHHPQGDAFAVHSDSNGWSDDVTIRDCLATDRGRASMSITGYGGHNIRFINNRCEKGTQSTKTSVSQGNAIALEPSVADDDCLNLTLHGNHCDGGISVTHQSGAIWDAAVITENHCEGIEVHRTQCARIGGNIHRAGTGILIQDHGTTAATGRMSVDGNILCDTSTGVTLSASATPGELMGPFILSGNLVDNSSDTGIEQAADCTNVVLTGNLAVDCTGSGISLLDIIQFVMASNLVADCGTPYLAVDSSSGNTHGPGLIVGNETYHATTTSKTSLQLSSVSAGTAEEILIQSNGLAYGHSTAYAIRDQGTSNYCFGRANLKAPTGSPTDDDL